MSTTDAFTLEAMKNNLSSYGEPKPIKVSNVSDIRGYNSSGIKIIDDKGQELKLTKDGLEQLAKLKDHIEAHFLPAKDHLNNDHNHMVNPNHVSYKEEKTIEGDEDIAAIKLPNGQELFLVDEEYKFGLNSEETKRALGIHTPPRPAPDPFA